MAINISAVQFQHNNFADALADYAVNAQFIELELTESVLMHNVEDVLTRLKRIKSMGFASPS